MDPSFILQTRGFRATSGNQVIRVIDLGEDGATISWLARPSDQDQSEFVAWAQTKLPAGTEVTKDMAGTGAAGIRKSRENYAAWKKKG